ncbi:MAG: hypothetical protein ACREUX_00920 [Burkholderiales bacterium]
MHALKATDLADRLKAQGLDPVGSIAQEFRGYMERHQEVTRQAGHGCFRGLTGPTRGTREEGLRALGQGRQGKQYPYRVMFASWLAKLHKLSTFVLSKLGLAK